MINSQSFALEDLLNNLDDNTQKLLGTIDQLPTDQVFTSIAEGRTQLNVEKAKDSTTHFGKLLEEYILTKHSDEINKILNEDIESFSVRERDLLDSRFLITKYKNELHVRSIVFGPSEQKTPRTHYERLGLRLFAIIANHIKTNTETIFEKVPFDFIGKQFRFTYDGPNKERIYIEEFTPRVIEVDPSIEDNRDEQNETKTITKKHQMNPKQLPKKTPNEPKTITKKTPNESNKIPKVIVKQICKIHRKDIDIDLTDMEFDKQLWTRIQDIAYGYSHYDQQTLVKLRETIQLIPWNYKNPDDAEAQEKWDDMIEALNNVYSQFNEKP